MKKLLNIAVIMIIMLIALTGCVNINYEVTLNSDGTANIAYIYGLEKENLEKMGTTAEDMTTEMKERATTQRYEVEAYSDDKIEGFKAKKHVENLSEISLAEVFGEENVKEAEENKISIDKKGLKTYYSQNSTIDLSSMEESIASIVTSKYTVNLPTKVGQNNADEVSEDGKTLTWNLKAGEISKIEFEANEWMLSSKIIMAIIICVIVILVVILIVKCNKKKKNK